MARIAVVVGTRPEIIKLSPVLRALSQTGSEHLFIHTGQQQDAAMADRVLEELALPHPDIQLQGATRLSRLTASIAEVLRPERVDLVVVQGDTNSVLCATLSAARQGIPVAHVEAGLRSYDPRTPEEHNRVVTDHLSAHLFAPTEHARQALLAEGLPAARICVTGNTIADVLQGLLQRGRAGPDRLDRFRVEPDQYLLLTAHRAENVDDPERFGTLLASVAAACDHLGLPALFPCHPRSRARLREHGLSVPSSIRLVEPLHLADFVALERHARLILTDSGGVQEEACILGVPCVTLREATERPETVALGANRVVGLQAPAVLEAVEQFLAAPRSWTHPFGDGRAGERIVAALTT